MTIAAVSWTSGTNKAAYSDDGDTWVRATAPSGSWERVTQNGASGFVAVSGGGGIVYHGSNASQARPDVEYPVMWVGSVEPTNALDGDVWLHS